MQSLSDIPEWQDLAEHADRFKSPDFSLSRLFSESPQRFERFSLREQGLLLDYSKNYLTDETLDKLLAFARARELPAAIAAMFRGDEINNTEARPALHVALRRNRAESEHPEVDATLEKMQAFVEAVHSGSWLGHTGQRIRHVVNLGIGGSDLGPAMVSEALAGFNAGKVQARFVSNVDPLHLETNLKGLHAATTLFVVASKSFTTLETRQNAEAARRWFLANGGSRDGVAKHFVAISTNLEAAAEFGIPEKNIFPMWDWVGGRYSLWSAIGLPIALALGMDRFQELLGGARDMDRHFREQDLEQNMPVLLALMTFWYTGFFDAHSTAVVPYAQALNQFPAFLQQLYMESLGKRVHRDGRPVKGNTGEVVWGTPGTNGQHSYFQLLHQGREFIPVDFIALARPVTDRGAEAHRHLLANCLSQSLALMEGTPDEPDPHKQHPGNRPSNTLLLDELSPASLGALIALYEHKVYALSVLWDINAFDQWGVELGKKLSKSVFAAFDDETMRAQLDGSSAGLIEQILARKDRR